MLVYSSLDPHKAAFVVLCAQRVPSRGASAWARSEPPPRDAGAAARRVAPARTGAGRAVGRAPRRVELAVALRAGARLLAPGQGGGCRSMVKAQFGQCPSSAFLCLLRACLAAVSARALPQLLELATSKADHFFLRLPVQEPLAAARRARATTRRSCCAIRSRARGCTIASSSCTTPRRLPTFFAHGSPLGRPRGCSRAGTTTMWASTTRGGGGGTLPGTW